MLEIREDQIEAMRAAVRASIPDAVLSFMRSRAVMANREDGAVVATDRCGQSTRVLFHPDGLPERLELPSGEHYRLECDAAGRVVAVEHSSAARVEIDRDENDCIVAVRRPGIDEHRFGYDEHGHLSTIRYPDASTLSLERDGEGRLLSQTDRTGARTTYQRSRDGTLVAVRDPLGRETQYETTGGALSAVVFPDGSREAYGYDPDQQLAAVTLRNGKNVQHELDHRGVIEGVVWPDGSFVAFDYDEQGRFTAARTADSSVVFDLDEDGEAIRERSDEGIVKFAYDPEGRLCRLMTPYGDAIEYTYDEDGRLQSIRDWEGRTHSYAYAADGSVREIRYGNGLVERQRYGTSGRLEHARVSSGSTVLSQQHYSYDVCGRMVEIEDVRREGSHLRKLWHDAEGRLTSSLDTGSALRRYEYDKKGNLIVDGELAIDVGSMDEPRSIGNEAIDYDELGNVVSFPSAMGRLQCAYASDGRMLETRVGDRTMRYAYDALGRRVLKTDGVRSWRYGWAGHQLLWEEYQEAPGARGIRRDYLWAPDSVVPILFREGGRSYWIQSDARGAPIRVFRHDGTPVWSARYDDFGQAHEELAHVRQPWRLPGQYHDAETGLHYSLGRYYSPELKIYLARDPQWFEPGATNYSYARQSPYNYADPMGALAFLLVAVAAVAVGAAVGAIAAAVTGGDPVAGAVGGAMAVVGGIVGGLVGGPVGMVAGGMIGSTAGAFTESLIEQARNGEPLCLKCAAKQAAIALGIDIALLGLGKIPGVRRLVRAIGTKLANKGQAIKGWARKQIARQRAVRWTNRQARNVTSDDMAKARELEPKYKARKAEVEHNYHHYDELPEGARPPVDKARLDKAYIGDPPGNRRPLNFKTDAEFAEFKGDVDQAFKNAGVTDAKVQQVGSATNGWSGNPMKDPINVGGKDYPKPWSPKSDTDFAVFSKDAMGQAQAQNVPVNTKNVLDERYAVFKNGKPGEGQMADTPLGKELQKVTEKWNDRLYGDQMEKIRLDKNLTPDQFKELKQNWDGVDFKVNTTSKPFPDRPGGPIQILNQGG